MGKIRLSVEQTISGCTTLIESGQFRGKELAVGYARRCEAYLRQNQRKPAMSDCDKAVQLDSDNVLVYRTRGELYVKEVQFDLAIQEYNQALRVEPNTQALYVQRGAIYASIGETDRAIQDFDKALTVELRWDDDPALLYRGKAYEKKGRLDLAIKDYSTIIKGITGSYVIPAYFARGEAYLKTGNIDGAIYDFSGAISRDFYDTSPAERNPDALSGLCYLRALKGEAKDTLEYCNWSLRIRRDDAKALYRRGYAYYRTGQWALAVTDFGAALNVDERMPEALYARGVAKNKLGSSGASDIAAAKAIQADIAAQMEKIGVGP